MTAPSGRLHLGYLLGLATLRFDAQVLARMAASEQLALRWTQRIERGQITAAQVHITRHLGRSGARLGQLAARARMSKQAMASLVGECEVLGLVQRSADARDARSKHISYTEAGLQWLAVYEQAVAQAEAAFRSEVGADIATVVSLGLEAYAAGLGEAETASPVKAVRLRI
jgi:DNA-binding MarR family transcriptional regulator